MPPLTSKLPESSKVAYTRSRAWEQECVQCMAVAVSLLPVPSVPAVPEGAPAITALTKPAGGGGEGSVQRSGDSEACACVPGRLP